VFFLCISRKASIIAIKMFGSYFPKDHFKIQLMALKWR